MIKNENILIVDDEIEILKVIKAYLLKDNYNVFSATNGKKASDIISNEEIDLVVLDLMLPDIIGEDLCKKIRVASDVPIIMLTAKVEEEDILTGLNIGADDYITKPFSPKELIARIKVILRRTKKQTIKSEILEFNNRDIIIDSVNFEVKKKGNDVKLTATEFKILEILAKNKGKVFSRDDLIVSILGYDYEGNDRTIDAHIKNLRHKIEDDYKYIKTVHGLGYRFMED